jgi:hypothetical protein
MVQITRCIASLSFLVMLVLPNTSAAYTLKRTPSGDQVRWHADRIELRVDPNLERMLPGGQARAAALMASEAWRGLPGVPEIVIEGGEPSKYDPARRGNAIYLVSEWPYDPDQLAVTLVTYAHTGVILGVDVLVNAQKSFALLHEGEDGPFATDHDLPHHDLGAVLTHELGHVLGLDESHEDEHATMWPYIRAGEAHQRSLSVDDEEAVIEAYGERSAAQACAVTGPLGRGESYGGALLTLMLAAALVALGRSRVAARRSAARAAARDQPVLQH